MLPVSLACPIINPNPKPTHIAQLRLGNSEKQLKVCNIVHDVEPDDADAHLKVLLWDTTHVKLGHLAALGFPEVR